MQKKNVLVENLEPGMIILTDVQDEVGRMIISSGSRLTPMMIKAIKKRNINSVFIKFEEEEQRPKSTRIKRLFSDSDEERQVMRKISEKVINRFKNLPKTDLNEELKRVAVKHIIKNKDELPWLVDDSKFFKR